jgi:hypothetical protein
VLEAAPDPGERVPVGGDDVDHGRDDALETGVDRAEGGERVRRDLVDLDVQVTDADQRAPRAERALVRHAAGGTTVTWWYTGVGGTQGWSG